MCLFSCFILFSFLLTDIWQKLKFITISLIKVRLLLLTLLVSTWFSCYILIFFFSFFFHSRHIFESIIFNIEDNVWFRFGGDVYRFLSFCFVLFSCVKKKKKERERIFCLAWGLCFEFVILLLLKEFHCFHAQFITHARSHSNTTCCWRIKMIRKSW